MIPVSVSARAHPRGRLSSDTWGAAGIALVVVLCLLDGGTTSPYVLFLLVLPAHAALAYPPIGVALAGTTIIAGHLGGDEFAPAAATPVLEAAAVAERGGRDRVVTTEDAGVPVP